MSTAELSEQLNLTSIRDHGWHMQVSMQAYSVIFAGSAVWRPFVLVSEHSQK